MVDILLSVSKERIWTLDYRRDPKTRSLVKMSQLRKPVYSFQ